MITTEEIILFGLAGSTENIPPAQMTITEITPETP